MSSLIKNHPLLNQFKPEVIDKCEQINKSKYGEPFWNSNSVSDQADYIKPCAQQLDRFNPGIIDKCEQIYINKYSFQEQSWNSREIFFQVNDIKACAVRLDGFSSEIVDKCAQIKESNLGWAGWNLGLSVSEQVISIKECATELAGTVNDHVEL